MFRSQFPRNTSPLKEFFKPSSRRLIASFTTPLRASHPQPNRGTRLSLPQRLPRRWVTTDAEAATEGDRRAAETSSEATKNASEPTQKQEQQSEIENPLQKDLDAKNREIIGLKVCSSHTFQPMFDDQAEPSTCLRLFPLPNLITDTSSLSTGLLPPPSCRLSQPPRAHKAGHGLRPAICHPTLRHRPPRIY